MNIGNVGRQFAKRLGKNSNPDNPAGNNLGGAPTGWEPTNPAGNLQAMNTRNVPRSESSPFKWSGPYSSNSPKVAKKTGFQRKPNMPTPGFSERESTGYGSY